jgi:hypothetical protein
MGNQDLHGCLIAWLILMIIGNAGIALIYLFLSDGIVAQVPDLPVWALPVLGVMAVFNLACTIALFFLKKWAFWGLVGSSVVVLVINLTAGLGLGRSLLGLVTVAVLFAVLHIGEHRKAWPQLE